MPGSLGVDAHVRCHVHDVVVRDRLEERVAVGSAQPVDVFVASHQSSDFSSRSLELVRLRGHREHRRRLPTGVRACDATALQPQHRRRGGAHDVVLENERCVVVVRAHQRLQRQRRQPPVGGDVQSLRPRQHVRHVAEKQGSERASRRAHVARFVRLDGALREETVVPTHLLAHVVRITDSLQPQRVVGHGKGHDLVAGERVVDQALSVVEYGRLELACRHRLGDGRIDVERATRVGHPLDQRARLDLLDEVEQVTLALVALGVARPFQAGRC